MAQETVTLNKKKIVVRPIAWGELPEMIEKVADTFENFTEIKKAFLKMILAADEKAPKTEQAEKGMLAALTAKFPRLVTTALAAALHIDEDELNEADALEVAIALEVTMRVCRIQELLAQGKKVRGLLATPPHLLAAPRTQATPKPKR